MTPSVSGAMLILADVMFGIVTRWGARGYGFVRPDGTEIAAWCQLRFLEGFERWPSAGERVEFELAELPDGRFQAHHVRPAATTHPSVPPPIGDSPRQPACSPAPEMPAAKAEVSSGTMALAFIRAGFPPQPSAPAAERPCGGRQRRRYVSGRRLPES